MIVTEYDLPRKEAMPHDVIVGQDGKVWYSDFGSQFVGVMDQKTGQVKDIAIPVLKPEQPKGGLDIEFDPAGNVWLSMMYQAGISKIDDGSSITRRTTTRRSSRVREVRRVAERDACSSSGATFRFLIRRRVS